CQQYNRLPRTF
nr:immunoglobulin light chain junction region [Macaca mulatta]MOV78880.1 immunoglobulin light chain junction region [Macaca mulatta]MOV80994.1 immunoglobulin light chain junction region [Macaca mulatta]MOV81025.1 immunoglobulin light chain junction region [Macaca mulatta]MOV81288.1 immunoglobulin light chain junction region [Macaca mulatta]